MEGFLNHYIFYFAIGPKHYFLRATPMNWVRMKGRYMDVPLFSIFSSFCSTVAFHIILYTVHVQRCVCVHLSFCIVWVSIVAVVSTETCVIIINVTPPKSYISSKNSFTHYHHEVNAYNIHFKKVLWITEKSTWLIL